MNFEQRLIAAANLVLEGDNCAEEAPVDCREFGVTATLKPHQVEGVSWLIRRLYSISNNGILGWISRLYSGHTALVIMCRAERKLQLSHNVIGEVDINGEEKEMAGAEAGDLRSVIFRLHMIDPSESKNNEPSELNMGCTLSIVCLLVTYSPKECEEQRMNYNIAQWVALAVVQSYNPRRKDLAAISLLLTWNVAYQKQHLWLLKNQLQSTWHELDIKIAPNGTQWNVFSENMLRYMAQRFLCILLSLALTLIPQTYAKTLLVIRRIGITNKKLYHVHGVFSWS